jgi:phosphate transport system substrate-binding protein
MSSDENAPFKYLNTVEGYRAIAEKKTDIFFGAYPSEEQIAYAEKFGTEFEYTPIGREAFVFFVNAKSDVDNLSSNDIRRIYSGEVKDWSELGFKPGEIKAFQRNKGSGSQSMFLRFMGDVAPEEPPKEERVDFMMGAYEVVSDYINNKGAIGFSFRYYIETVIGRKDVKLISVDGIAPTVENIKSGTYPITGDLYAVTWKGNPNKNVEVLLDWITGLQGQYIIEKTGYAPVS